MKVSTRRSFFRYLALLGLVTFSATPVYAKALKDKVKYQELPHDAQHCSTCNHFLPKEKQCVLVEGPINPNGWCMLYFKKVEKAGS